jgi:hypothetical protein
VPKARRTPVAGSSLGKNRGPKTRAAADPYRKKSYHSMAVPIRLANTTLWMEFFGRVPAAVPDAFTFEGDITFLNK